MNMLSPTALTPNGNPSTEPNPFESEFAEEELEEADDVVELPQPGQQSEESNFAVLNSSLPGEQSAAPHHLTSYASAKRSGGGGSKEKKQHRTRWHFGIRSRSPPMEVMSAIYASLKALGMEWREKRDLGGLCAFHPRAPSEANGLSPNRIERNRSLDASNFRVDLRTAAAIYFVETRARQDDIVVLMNVQLYYVDGDNYLVDFHHKRSYRASTAPGAGRFDAAQPFAPSESGSDAGSVLPQDGQVKEESIVSPYVFMDVACKLILDLAGGAEEAR